MIKVQRKLNSKLCPLYLVASSNALYGIFWSDQKLPKAKSGSAEEKMLDKAERQILVDVLQRIRQMGKAMVIVACSWNQIAAISSHLCVMVSDGVLGFGEVSEIKPILSSLTMNQVLFGGGGFANSIRFLDAHPHVYHLSVSTDQQRLVRFIYDARQQPFPELLETMKNQGASIVSVGEDRSFPGLSEQY